MRRLVREVVALFIALVVGAIAFAIAQFAAEPLLFGRIHPEFGTVVFIVCSTVIPAGLARFAWSRMRLRLGCEGPLLRSRTLQWILVASYLLTWAFGVPAVHSSLVKFEVSEYKRMRAENNRVWDAHPRIEFAFDVPVLPFVILSYHEYQLAGLYGWGGWDLHFWYGGRPQRIIGLPLWLS